MAALFYNGGDSIATTRIIPMHHNQGKSIAKCLAERLDYAKDPDKTANGRFISAYQCNPGIADAEFLFSKRQYLTMTGKEQNSDVIAYQVRQSFKPGEITPEEANRVGYEFAMRFLKGKHAFIVATHVDKKHIHNHIIFNSTTLDCRRKFRDFHRSGMAVRKLSDIICVEHGLSIIENPQRRGKSYDAWLGDKKQPSHREKLRYAIDDALAQKPETFVGLLRLLSNAGYEVKQTGKEISLRGPEEKRFMRLSSLKAPYTQEMLTAVIAGEKKHTPKKRPPTASSQPSLLVDIDAKLREGKGVGYQKWAGNFNLKQTAQTLSYLSEHKLLDYRELAAASEHADKKLHRLTARIKTVEARMDDISKLQTHIINYARTREVYADYRKAGYSKKFLAAHESEILLHKAAKKAFDELGLKRLPSVKSLRAEYADLLTEKKMLYAEYRKTRDEARQLHIHKSNVDILLGQDAERHDRQRHKEQESR